MYVCWESKILKEPSCPEHSKTLGKRYSRLGNAWYKMYQLTLKGYDGVHCCFEENEVWNVDGVKFNYDDDMVWLTEYNNKWYFCGNKRVDITDEIEYFQKRIARAIVY